MRKNVWAFLGLTMVLGAFTTACDRNPLASDRDKGLYMYTNPSFAQVTAGKTTTVRANVMNKYLAPTGEAVTATPCDAKITAVADTSRTVFEQPERFVVTGVTPGKSCLVVSGGGVSDTVNFVVGPASVKLTADAALASGQTKPISVSFLPSNGTLTNSSVTYVSRDTLKVAIDNTALTMSGRAPGATYVVATLNSGLGQTVKDSVLVTVSAGAFGGTAPTTIARGTLVTLTAGPIPFDANTAVTINGNAVYPQSQTATTLTFVVPDMTGSTALVAVANMGPNEISQTFTVPLTAEPGEPDNSSATARAYTFGSTVYGSVSASDVHDFWSFVAPAAGTGTVDLDWIAGGTTATNDVDATVRTAAGVVVATGCGTSAHPEHCTFTMVAGTTYVVDVQSYAIPATLLSQPYKLSVK